MELIDREKLISNIDNIAEFIYQYDKEYTDMIKSLLVDCIFVYGFEDDSIKWNKNDGIVDLLKTFSLTALPNRYDVIPTSLSQLLSKFNIYNTNDLYLYMYELLKKYSFLNGNCCEIGAGKYPRLAEIISPDLEKNNHNLIIYDPKIVISRLSKTIIIKDRFTKKADFSNIDTIIGMLPCDATVDMTEKAFEEDKNILLATCGCNHTCRKHKIKDSDYWALDFCSDYKEKYGDEAIIEMWPSTYGIPYPILIRESSKQKLKIKYESNMSK